MITKRSADADIAFYYEVLSAVLMSCLIVLSLFFGIKFRWFRYQMKILNTEELPPSSILNTTVKEVRENCSIGRYSCIEDNSIGSTNNCMSSISSSPPSNSVKSKKSKYPLIITLNYTVCDKK